MPNPEDYTQKKDGWCGQASLSYALAQQGRNVSQEELAKETTAGTGGIDPDEMEKCVTNQRMKNIVVQGNNSRETLTMLKFYLSSGWSVILDYLAGNTIEDGHYVVLNKIHNDSLEVFDPSVKGKIKQLDLDNFIRHWMDKDEQGKKFKYYALAIHK